MVDTMTLVLAAGAMLCSLAAVALGLLALRRTQRPGIAAGDPLPEDLHGLRQEVAALRAEGVESLRHLAVVRYDAFDDTGGHLSWSMALVDDSGNGALLTSIHGRNEARTYAKNVVGWGCEQPLSPEEQKALSHARS